MPVYLHEDAGFWDVAPRSLQWAVERTRGSGFRVHHFPMADDPDDAGAPVATLFAIPPGGVVERHAHDCHRVEVVVQGSLQVADGTILRPGDVSVSAPREYYGPHTAGPEGAITVEIFANAASVLPEHEEPWPSGS